MGVVRITSATLPRSLQGAAIGVIPILAFDDEALQAQATLAILVASLLAGLIGTGSLLLCHHLVRSATSLQGS